MKSLARATLVVATLVAVGFALLQVGGRMLFLQLPRFEGAINALLGPELVVHGLVGRWQGINPGFFAESVRFGAGELSGFDFELDLIESLRRDRIVARRMTVEDGRLTFEKTATGWQLEDAPEGPGMDVLALFAHSGEIWIRGRVFAREGRRMAALHVESWLINIGSRHRFSVQVRSEPNCADCALAVEGDITRHGPGAVQVFASSFSPGTELAGMFGLPGFEVALAGDWRRENQSTGRARLDIGMTRIGTPGIASTLTARLGAWTEGGGYRGRFDTLSLSSGHRSLHFGGAGFFVAADIGSFFADLWLPEFDAAEVAALLVTAAGVEHPVGRWLHHLTPRGRIGGFRVRVDRDGAAFSCRVRDAAIASYRGVPAANRVAFVAEGYNRTMRFTLDGYDVDVALPDFVAADETYSRGGGALVFSFGSGNLGIRGERLWLDLGSTRAVADLAISRTAGAEAASLTVDAKVDRIAGVQAREYLPLRVAPGLRTWLDESIRAGHLEDVRILFQGEIGTRSESPGGHFEMVAKVVDGVVDYHPDWPPATRVNADLVVAGTKTRLQGSASVFDMDIGDVDLRLPSSGDGLALHLRSRAEVGRLLDFARQSPLREGVPFLSETWTGTGPVVVAAELDLPLTGDEGLRPRSLLVDFGFEEAGIDLANRGLRFDSLVGRVRYQWPWDLSSGQLVGRLFGAPVRIGIDSAAAAIRFHVDGSATIADAYRILDLAALDMAEGRFDFNAQFAVFPALEHPAELRIESDLRGVSATLPEPLGKSPDHASAFAVSLQFLDDYVAVSVRYDGVNGWLHVADDGILAAALGVGVPVPMVDAAGGRVVVAGGLDSLDASAIAAVFDSPGIDGAGFAWELRDFRIGSIVFDTLELVDVHVDGHAENGEVRLALTGRDFRGTLARSGAAPWRVEIPELDLPAAEEATLDPAVIDRLIAADVILGRVRVGEEDYGTWRFGLRPVADGIELRDVVAQLRGLAIETTAPVLWSRGGTTWFRGSVTAGDLRDVLPLWDFVPHVESESFFATGSVHWPGSPLDFDLANVSGDASLELTKGRFLEVEQGAGAARIMSLINFSTLVKRVSLDFTDVIGRGMSFDRVLADLRMTDGRARFDGPAKVTGTGLRFEIEGTVDFATGTLDNTLLVTLPLHTSLPWYAAFIAASNPLAAAGVLAGQQMFKDPLKRLSSIVVRVQGTFDDQDVAVVGNASALAAAAESAGGSGDDAASDRSEAVAVSDIEDGDSGGSEPREPGE